MDASTRLGEGEFNQPINVDLKNKEVTVDSDQKTDKLLSTVTNKIITPSFERMKAVSSTPQSLLTRAFVSIQKSFSFNSIQNITEQKIQLEKKIIKLADDIVSIKTSNEKLNWIDPKNPKKEIADSPQEREQQVSLRQDKLRSLQLKLRGVDEQFEKLAEPGTEKGVDSGKKPDIVIVGAGPVGITTACALKALNKELNIVVIDGREKATRHHALLPHIPAVFAITSLVAKAILFPDNKVNVQAAKELGKIFLNWTLRAVRTSRIEGTLATLANQIGVTVLRGEQYKLTDKTIESIQKGNFEEEEITDEHSEKEAASIERENKLKDIFRDAKVIVGADGAHSVVRSKMMKMEKSDEETLQHLIELKFDVNASTKSDRTKALLFDGGRHGEIEIVTMDGASRKGGDIKPATLHILVDQETFNLIKTKDEKGNPIGDFINPWKLKGLKARLETMTDPKQQAKLGKYVKIMSRYLEGAEQRGGKPLNEAGFNEKITVIPMAVYRSVNAAQMVKGKVVTLVGDASSGLIFVMGFNKGLVEAVKMTKNVVAYFNRIKNEKVKTETQPISDELPVEFKKYQKEARSAFKLGNTWAHGIHKALNTLKGAFKVSASTADSTSGDGLNEPQNIKKDQKNSSSSTTS